MSEDEISWAVFLIEDEHEFRDVVRAYIKTYGISALLEFIANVIENEFTVEEQEDE